MNLVENLGAFCVGFGCNLSVLSMLFRGGFKNS